MLIYTTLRQRLLNAEFSIGRLRPAAFAFAACAGLGLSQAAGQGVVVISDGFGDADLNNNGIPLENFDTNVQGGLEDTTWVPGRLDDPGTGDPPPGSPENNEVTTVLDANDTGIAWSSIRGFTGKASSGVPGAGPASPTLRILDDTQGALLETQPVTNPGGLGIDAIDSGYALSFQGRGRGATAGGFFGRRIGLGGEVDDELKVSFDWRLWRDADNDEELSVDEANIRFGLFQDTDNQLGQTNPFAGRQVDSEGEPLPNQLSQFQPAVWGQDDGLFNGRLFNIGAGSEVGSVGDLGWTVEVPVGDNFSTDENGGTARIREEAQSDTILEGSDVEFVARPPNLAADPLFDPPLYDFIDLSSDRVYNIELSLKRVTDVDEADSIMATLTITDKLTQETDSFSGMETDWGSDSFDYFAIRTTGNNSSDEFDSLLDNFEIEVIGSNAQVEGDFNFDGVVNAADYTVWRDNFGAGDETTLNGNGDGLNGVDIEDYNLWKANFGALAGTPFEPAPSAVAAPEPTSAALGLLSAAGLLAARRRRDRASKRRGGWLLQQPTARTEQRRRV